MMRRMPHSQLPCQASGNCDSTDFFYSPTTFNLREQEFVFDSVVRFYREDVGRECATPENWQMQSNDRLLKDCASVRMQPFLVIAESLRDSKRIFLLIGYHGVRVLFWGIQLLVSSTMDAAANFADAASYSLEHITARLLLEVRALMQQIGNFVEQMRDTLIALALSRMSIHQQRADTRRHYIGFSLLFRKNSTRNWRFILLYWRNRKNSAGYTRDVE